MFDRWTESALSSLSIAVYGANVPFCDPSSHGIETKSNPTDAV